KQRQETFKNSTSVKITRVGTKTIAVQAAEEDQPLIAHLIKMGPTKGGTRTIILNSASSPELAEAIERAIKMMRKNPVQVVPPGKPEKENSPKLPKKDE